MCMKIKYQLFIYSFLFAGILSFTACQNGGGNQNTKPDSTMVANEELPDRDSMFEAGSIDTMLRRTDTLMLHPSGTNVKVVIHRLDGYGQDEAFAKQTARLLERIINSTEFRQKVTTTNFPFHNNGHSGAEIYGLIMKAHEIDGPGGTDSVVDLRLRTITREQDGGKWIRACNRSTIGIDGGGTGVAAVCPNWLRSTAAGQHYSWLAAHFIHEYMHILDFRHPDHKSQSVPYIIQHIVESIAGG